MITIHTSFLNDTFNGPRHIFGGIDSACHLYILPRTNISMARTIDDIARYPAVYVLMGHGEAYIGQTTNIPVRLRHHMKKSFWHTAYIFISAYHSLFGDDIRFIEHLAIQRAMSLHLTPLRNTEAPARPRLPGYRVAELETFFSQLTLLAEFAGLPLFTVPEAAPAVRARRPPVINTAHPLPPAPQAPHLQPPAPRAPHPLVTTLRSPRGPCLYSESGNRHNPYSILTSVGKFSHSRQNHQKGRCKHACGVKLRRQSGE